MTDYKALFSKKNAYERLIELKESGALFEDIPVLKECFECEQETVHHCYNVGEHIMHSVMEAVNRGYSPVICTAMLLHDTGKPAAKKYDENGTAHFFSHALISADIAKKIVPEMESFTDEEKREILFLVKEHDRFMKDYKKKTVRKFMNEYGYDYCRDLAYVRYCDTLAQSEYKRDEKLENIRRFEDMTDEMRSSAANDNI